MILFSDSAKEKIKALPQGSLLLTHLEAYQLYIDTTNEREVNLFNELVSNLENGNDCTSMIQQEKKYYKNKVITKKISSIELFAQPDSGSAAHWVSG